MLTTLDSILWHLKNTPFNITHIKSPQKHIHILKCLYHILKSWRRNQMEIFSASLVLCEGSSPVTGEFPPQRPVTRSFDVFFDLRLHNGWASHRDAGYLRRHRIHHCNDLSRSQPPMTQTCFTDIPFHQMYKKMGRFSIRYLSIWKTFIILHPQIKASCEFLVSYNE